MDDKDLIKQLSKRAVEKGETPSLAVRTRSGGSLVMLFRPTGRVEMTWRDRGGLKEGWFSKDWTIGTTLRRWDELMKY